MATPEELLQIYNDHVNEPDGGHERAMQALRDAAHAGYGVAQYEFSKWQKGDEQNAWLTRAVASGSASAAFELGWHAERASDGRIEGKTNSEWLRVAEDIALAGTDGTDCHRVGMAIRNDAGRDQAALRRALAVLEHGAALGNESSKAQVSILQLAQWLMDMPFSEGVGEVCQSLGLAQEETARVVNLARPSRRAIATKDATARSCLGGLPVLPAETEWPKHGDKPLALVAQIDLGEAALSKLVPGLPATGLLLFFVDSQGFFSSIPATVGTRVLHVSASSGEPREIQNGAEAFERTPLVFADEGTIPFPRTALARNALGDKTDVYWKLWEILLQARIPACADGHVHRLLGHADAIQGDMGRRFVYDQAEVKLDEEPNPVLDAQAARWRLLLQIDSETSANMMWGDLGRIYFLIDEDDLANGRFENVQCVLQCG